VWAATDSTLAGFAFSAGAAETRLEMPVNGLGCLALSPDDRYAISGSNDQTVRIYDLLRRGQEVVKLQHHTGALAGVALRPDGRVLASIGHDHHLKIWGRVTGGMARIRPKGFCGIRVQADAAGRVVIADVIAGTAAQAAGMRPGDVLRSVGGIDIHNTTDSVDRIGSYLEGDEVEFVVERSGEVKTLRFKLGKRPEDFEN
jgi:S1-C subfamily serine protease